MTGASSGTERVTYVNANWTPGAGRGTSPEDLQASRFELLVVTESGERHVVPVEPGDMAAIVALTQASSVLLWDPDGPSLIAANLVGQWIPDTSSASDAT